MQTERLVRQPPSQERQQSGYREQVIQLDQRWKYSGNQELARRAAARKAAARKKKLCRLLLLLIAALILISAVWILRNWNGLLNEVEAGGKIVCDFNGHNKRLTGEDFGIETVHSPVDFNNNGVDDYTDILQGAKADAKRCPRYDGTYCAGGYPPDDVGVCTDVVWRALKQAGYSLRNMVDEDITRRPWAYSAVNAQDWNIDFRRVKNLRVFFDEYAQVLTNDIEKIEEWQPGDIVIFGDDRHIGVVSDRRNEAGHAYILHNSGQPDREQDYLGTETATVAAHYRFDASNLPDWLKIPWTD